MSSKRFRKRTIDHTKPIAIVTGNDDEFVQMKRELNTFYYQSSFKNIVIPTISEVERVHDDKLPRQSTYIQYAGPTQKEYMSHILYDMDEADNTFFQELAKKYASLHLSHLFFELVIDRLEKCTGWFLNGMRYASVDDLLHMGLARKNKNFERADCSIGKSFDHRKPVRTLSINALSTKRSTTIPFHDDNTPISRTLVVDKHNREVIEAIQAYWKKKRQQRIDATYYPHTGAPLLRQYDKPPDMNDENYKVPFRPREKPPSQVFGNHIYTHERIDHIIDNLKNTDTLLQKLEERLQHQREYMSVMRELLGYELRYVQQYGVRRASNDDPNPPTKKRRLQTTYPLDHFLEGCQKHSKPIFYWALKLHKTQSLPQEPTGPLADTYFPVMDRLGRVLLRPATRLSANPLVNDPDMQSLHLTNRLTHDTDFVDDFCLKPTTTSRFANDNAFGFEESNET